MSFLIVCRKRERAGAGLTFSRDKSRNTVECQDHLSSLADSRRERNCMDTHGPNSHSPSNLCGEGCRMSASNATHMRHAPLAQGISIRVASPNLVTEEAPESHKHMIIYDI